MNKKENNDVKKHRYKLVKMCDDEIESRICLHKWCSFFLCKFILYKYVWSIENVLQWRTQIFVVCKCEVVIVTWERCQICVVCECKLKYV